MASRSESIRLFTQHFEETDRLTNKQILLGLFASTLIMIGSTWGVLSLLNFVQVYPVDLSKIVPYTLYMLFASALSIVIAILICLGMTRWPRIVSLPLKIHHFAKRNTGEYFLSPETPEQGLSVVLRRSLYGSILVVGISLTILGFDLMVANAEEIIPSGTFLMLASIIVLPFTVMEFYFGPWLMKDSGLFHLDERDRSLSNVGDDLEDILEFFAGVDILFLLLELTISVGPSAPWLPVFIILIPLGPLFSIVLNFTLVFIYFRNKATSSMMECLSAKYEVPDILSSSDYIRDRVISLVDRNLIMTPVLADIIESEPHLEDTISSSLDVISEVETDDDNEPELLEESELALEDDS
ncbi:MAG: hypothetical protein JW779_16315 [Candidatus Thorarchaeota archaeon]|nr:hypothetical protein [Candidatus Thorarchaeota archaeon]